MNVFLLAAITADGCIGSTSSHRSFDWTSEEDKHFYVRKIKEAGTVVMGATTFKTFTRYPRGLHYVIYTSHPETFVNPKPEVITTEATHATPQELLKKLEAEGRNTVAVCGGASIYSVFMKAGVVNKLYLSVEPVLFGKGIHLFQEELDIKLHLADVQKLNTQTLLLEYEVI